MPGIEDWRTTPLSTIQNIFDESKNASHDEFVHKVEEYFTQRLTEDVLKSLPTLNDTPLDQHKSGCVVKYRCMVQDVFDPQYYAGQYTVTNKDCGTPRVECGSYRDVPQLKANETADFNSSHAVTVERQGFYCVPIPGEAQWVKEITKKCSRRMDQSSLTSQVNREKRSRDDQDVEEMESDQKCTKEHQRPASSSQSQVDGDASVTNGGNSHMNAEAETSSKTPLKLPDLNLPLPDEMGVPSIVRVYSNTVELKVTDTLEIVGVLCMDPRLASIYDEENHSEEMMEKEELQAHEPPASLVPRLHALVIRKLQHNNPHLPPVVGSDSYKQAVSHLMTDACSLRLELISVLQHALLGDRLAAEYLLYQMIANIYARVDVLPLGKLGVNLSHCPTLPRYTRFLHHLIAQLTTQSVYVDMSIEKMNSATLVPKKDYTQNRITAGMLQLTSGTSLVVDETVLQQGQLSAQGVSNVKALADVIKWQKVDYDYQWHPIPVPSNVNVLVLSEGESLLPKDIHVPLSPTAVVDATFDIGVHFSKLDSRLSGVHLEKLRSYISVCQHTEYVVDETTQKIIQDDFVETRQDNPNNMSVEDFQTLLGLLRLICISYGMTSPTVEMWRAAKSLEVERKARVALLPASSNTRPTL